MEDDNDLTDRYKQLEGKTLSDEHKDNPDPPIKYGKPDPRTIIEMVGPIAWAWNSRNADANIQYYGELVEVKE